ncbi:MAG: hypothetical protein IPK82_30395 [Polyangiaceae bacterium]|nr:hypothetical protein [Polyangiaceae bacterium]
MQRWVRSALFGLLFGVGCSPISAPPPLPLQVAGAEKVLPVAFDDIHAPVAAAVPISLTASDGSGLKLSDLKGRMVIDDPLAFTELHLTFENPESRVLEGTFSIVLPQGAAISRFAMKNGDEWKEGEVVEKQQARRAYEDFLHRRQDPALLEQAGGNQFSARVFPIAGRAKKEIIVSYSQELSKGAAYTLSLKGLGEIGSVDVTAWLAGKTSPIASYAKQNTKLETDFRVEMPPAGGTSGIRSGNLVLTRVVPITAPVPEPMSGALILVDTSASRALGMIEQARLLRALCTQLARAAGAKAPVTVAAFDQTVEPIFAGGAADFDDAAIDRMRQRLALGASNLEGALAWAHERARSERFRRVVVVTDGVATLGAVAGEMLRARVKALSSVGVERMDALALGGIRDDDLLKSLVNAGLPRGGVVLDASAIGVEEVWRRLNEGTRSEIDVRIENASFVFPNKINGVQSGDEVLVYANVPDDKPVRVAVGAGAFEERRLRTVERPLLERAWVGAKIRSLVESERVSGASASLSREIVGLSTKYRVLSPKTALLVLETEQDYDRFGIDRRALADILTVYGDRVALKARPWTGPKLVQVTKNQVVIAPPPSPPRNKSATATAPPPAPKAAKRSFDADFGGGSSSGGKGGGSGAGAGAPVAAAATASPAPRASGGASQLPPPSATEAKKDAADEPAAPSPPTQSPSQVRSDDTRRESSASASPTSIATAAPVATPTATGPSVGAGSSPADPEPRAAADSVPRVIRLEPLRAVEEEVPTGEVDPYSGPFKSVMALVATNQISRAVTEAFAWRKTAPGDVLALVALGEAFESAGNTTQAARCYGSIIDLFPGRADLRRFAGERLERVAASDPSVLAIAVDTFQKAATDRPDHPASHRLLAYALLKQGRFEQAFQAIARGVRGPYPAGRFRGVHRILQEDAGLIAAAWTRAEPSRSSEILEALRSLGAVAESGPSLRFVLNWETDANDVDFHIFDAQKGHAWYSNAQLDSGGELYADVTDGYGPECFTIRQTAKQRAAPYRLQAHYYSRGPMGYGMGKLQIIEHDGRGVLTIEDRPFVVMTDKAFVNLGSAR